jgi:predicted double-glycine peptidase
VTRPARNSGPTIDWSEEAATRTPGQSSRHALQRGFDERDPYAFAPGRDREATRARPIVRLLDNSPEEDSGASRGIALRLGAPGASGENRAALEIPSAWDTEDSDDTADTLPTPTIIPSGRPPIILPRARRRPSRGIAIARTVLIALVLYFALSSSLQILGRPGLPLAPFPWASANGASVAVAATVPLRMDGKVASRVQPMTQMRRVDLYDSRAQFSQWAGAACSAATLAEILTAYGVPHITIGRMIRELGKDISPNWGLLTYNAFNRVVAKYGLRADVYLSDNPLSYKQMLYLTNNLGVPVVVNMRATTGYYHYLSGGHILVMTGGDSRTIHLADSSLYFMKSLPLGTYNQMARPRNVVIVPKDFHYTLPR